MAGDTGSALQDLGGAVGDLFGMFGSQQAASSYGTAADIALQNEALTKRSTAIQVQQQGIQAYKVLGAESADVSGAGFTQGGSAGDLMRSSAQQAALSKQLVQTQGDVTALGFEQQADAYKGQEEAANVKASGQGIGGLIGLASAAFSFF